MSMARLTSSNRSIFVDSICSALSNRYSMRIKLQKVEFCLCWLLFLVNTLCVVGTVGATASISILSFTHFYVQASIVSRVIAYAFDFSRAYVKTNSIPEWLKLHHFGVLLQHTTMGYFILGRTYNLCLDYSYNDINNGSEMMTICNGLLRLRLIVYLLGSQASHNTWTKRFSLVLCWGNTFGIGVPCGIASLVLSSFWTEDYISNNGADIVVQIANVVYVLSLSITMLGVLKFKTIF